MTFTAAADITTPTIQWQASANGGSSWINVSGATNPTFTATNLAGFENGWELRAVFTNYVGSATSTPAAITVTAPTTSVVLPSNNATSSGNQYLDAVASSGVTGVKYEVTGGSLSDSVIATATPTIYGWLASWNTTTVPNGTYTLQSLATSGGSLAQAQASPSVSTIRHRRRVSYCRRTMPRSSGNQYLDAVASSGVTGVKYEVTGGSLSDSVIATATPTIYGWLASWNTTTVPNGTYALQSVASYAGGVSGASAPITVSVTN